MRTVTVHIGQDELESSREEHLLSLQGSIILESDIAIFERARISTRTFERLVELTPCNPIELFRDPIAAKLDAYGIHIAGSEYDLLRCCDEDVLVVRGVPSIKTSESNCQPWEFSSIRIQFWTMGLLSVTDFELSFIVSSLNGSQEVQMIYNGLNKTTLSVDEITRIRILTKISPGRDYFFIRPFEGGKFLKFHSFSAKARL